MSITTIWSLILLKDVLRSTHVDVFLGNEYAGNSQITSVAMKRAVNTTIEESMFLCASHISIAGQWIYFLWVRLETI
jgi:hypothetical protein